MNDIVSALLGGSIGAAVVSGVFTLIQYRIKRQDERADRNCAQTKALRYIMLYIIQETAKGHIRDGKITLEDRRKLRHWHDLYHDGLEGNGDADALMLEVDNLPTWIKTENI